MTPNPFGSSATLYLKASQEDVHQEKSTAGKPANTQTLLVQKSSSKPRHEWKIVWIMVLGIIYLHLAFLYGVYLSFVSAKVATTIWSISTGILGGIGITAGAHRLWSHKAYKAKWPMQLILMILQTVSAQNHIYAWVRNHRVHHKYTDTNADPHNAQRGFFFSHVGWLLIRKHPDVKMKGSTIDMSDMEKDPIVVWQRRLYIILMPVLSFVIPVMVPCYFWNETLLNSWFAVMMRYALILHWTWLVNSAAHMWGIKPYDKTISSTDSKSVAIVAFGEGWHNYHHVFPWDYKAAELGNYNMNVTTAFIDLFAKLGWAYDMKTVPVDVIRKRAERTGDGSRYKKGSPIHEHSHKDMKWGWGDPDVTPEEIQEVEIINKSD